MKKIIIGIGVLVSAGAGFFLYQNTQANAKDSTSVELYQVSKQTPLHLKGQVQSTKKQTVLVNAEKGPVQTIHVNEGDHVTKDQILVTYRWGEVIRAANDSVVTSMNEDAKNDPQQALMVLKSEESAIKGTVTEYDRSKVVLNEPIEIKYANNEKIVKGKITSLAEMNNESTKEDTNSLVTYNYTAVPDEAIPMGYSVELLIPRNEIHLPLKSVVDKDGEQSIYTVVKGKAEKRTVIVEKGNGYYTLREGLNENDKIIKDAEDVKDGMDVTVG
ncbi:efflux RND transporter periplasmic adaptor subunit [Enterococcus pseudoavium]|uniref:efflux RND transporter periplasmic adaptor subunit n=1 Tax=Enterococcus pseudoavium TaxID=44007 RepID=UPI00288E7603|nr:efflux RND transporter periplasmic adaptor subunit [Enterococcus pseudoavium]MDT2755409.1 efflux RND transporter periplasmic adaptor subunit [Enterococcus pseudoavium]